MSKPEFIEIKGARMHNLKNIDVAIKQNSFTVVTGVSGSGKSSLVFDTLFAEGQRRYVESLSSYARQFLGRMNKPVFDFIEGLAPAIAIEQKVNTRNPRSTVATSTEIYDYLKLLFSRVGKTFSPISQLEVKRHTTEDVIKYLQLPEHENKVALILTQLIFSKDNIQSKIDILIQQGFTRLFADSELLKLSEINTKQLLKSKQVFLVHDRILLANDKLNTEVDNRMADSIENAFWEGKGKCTIFIENTLAEFSNLYELDGISFELPDINILSFNNPMGACTKCEGFGNVIGIDPDLVIPNKSLSVFEGCVAPWKGDTLGEWRTQFLKQSIRYNFPVHRAYNDLNEEEMNMLWRGNQHVQGIDAFFEFVETQLYKIQYRVMQSRYKGKTICPECNGTRLRKEAGYIKLLATHNGKEKKISLPEVLLMTIDEAYQFFSSIQLSKADTIIAEQIFTEINNRLKFLKNVGLGYLSLNRLSNSLSGGESQRINLATTLGSSLTGSMYILDEPSIGLHPRDTHQLIGVLKNLQSIGNTVIVVEHEEEMMKAADQLIDIGKYAGINGGNVVFNGCFSEILTHTDSLTGSYLNGNEKIIVPNLRKKWKNYIEIAGAREHNLKNFNVKIPLFVFTCITGVSGSGKTTLIKNLFYPALQKIIGDFTGLRTGNFEKLNGDIHLVKHVELVNQEPIGKSSRSNPVTYVKAYDAIRELFAEQDSAKAQKLKPSHFSFNVDGGRCDQCKGDGEQTIEMQFMADIVLPCEFCNGKRFKEHILEIKYKGKNIAEVLQMSVDEAMEFFNDQSIVQARLEPLQRVGLGYISLGQSSNTLSGGEAQRVKLATFLGKGNAKEQHTVFIFDEPTTGLHFHDINKLLFCMNELVEKGHTVIVIEHNTEVIKCADWIIDLGPEGGKAGGSIVFEGTPEELAKSGVGYTSQFLKDKLSV